MAKLYTLDKQAIEEKPELRIGDRVYKIDDRYSTFERINRELQSKESGSEFEIIVGGALGTAALDEITALDLPFAAMQRVVTLIMAAIQGVDEEEAACRFRG